jgi:hypothetical protein
MVVRTSGAYSGVNVVCGRARDTVSTLGAYTAVIVVTRRTPGPARRR